MSELAMIVGAGQGLSASLARRCAGEGMRVVLAAPMEQTGAIAKTSLHTHRQHRSAWTWEIELRPWVERFRDPQAGGIWKIGDLKSEA